MIYTVTLNPSLDYIIGAPEAKGGIHRLTSEQLRPGGKGLNVSQVLQRLETKNEAIAMFAGVTGEAIMQLLREDGCTVQPIRLTAGTSRLNVKITSPQQEEYNGPGTPITPEAMAMLTDMLHVFGKGDTVVLAGSIPPGLPTSVYADFFDEISPEVRVVVDAAGDVLRQAVSKAPFLVKPNRHELGDLFGTTILSSEQAVTYARQLQARGARNVLVSLDKNGAVLVTEGGKEAFCATVPTVPSPCAVGAGDSVVAGFLAALQNGQEMKEAFRYGIAAGVATTATGTFAGKESVSRFLPQIKMTALNI